MTWRPMQPGEKAAKPRLFIFTVSEQHVPESFSKEDTMKKTVLAAAIALLPVAALADSGLYAGFSIGRSIIEDAGSAGPGQSIEKNSTAYKLQLGYRINPNLAIEGGYLNLGKFAYDY